MTYHPVRLKCVKIDLLTNQQTSSISSVCDHHYQSSSPTSSSLSAYIDCLTADMQPLDQFSLARPQLDHTKPKTDFFFFTPELLLKTATGGLCAPIAEITQARIPSSSSSSSSSSSYFFFFFLLIFFLSLLLLHCFFLSFFL